MSEIVQFPADQVELARLRRAYQAELERMTEQGMPLPDKRARKAGQAYSMALARVEGRFAD
jgi:hypothetical protein